ncbi:MAG: glycoside hydrolase family 31 protein [Byssovorax sp.]
MPSRHLAHLAALPLITLAAGCTPDEGVSSVPVPVPVGSGFAVSLHDGNRLVIASASGKVLLDGLPPADTSDKGPPLTGFAVRDLTTQFEMQFGSFRPIDDAKGPWRGARTIVAGAEKSSLDLKDAAGAILAHLALAEPEPGHLTVAVTPGDGPERRFSWGFACAADDHFAGFGAQSLDVDHRGQTVPTWVQEQGVGKQEDDSYNGVWFLTGTRHASQMPIPQYLSSRGYILTAENDLRSIFALCAEGNKDAARVEMSLPGTIHLFDGPSPAEAIARATATFGRPRLPPRYAFAPWLDAIEGSESVRAVAKQLRDEKIPSSVIWTEDWRGGDWNKDNYTLKEDWELDPTLYPDFPALAGDLHAEGFSFLVYFNPFVYKKSKAWNETADKGYLVKREDGTPYTFTGAKFTDTGLIDLDNPDGRAWAVGKMQGAIALGADGWMNDFAEWLPTDGVTGKGPSLERHNHYAVAWQETAREAIDGVNDGQQRLFFSRSGWFGTPPLVDVFWAGDQRTDFEEDDGMPTVLPIGIGLGIVGESTYGHDIGGYQSATNPPATKEVYFRWTELGAWSPVMRTHHGTQPKKQWSWRSDAETIAHFRRYAELHMALVPFLEGLSAAASQTGMPMWRGLMLRFPGDAKAWTTLDEVMLGDGLVLAPVMTAGASSRSVYLPEGAYYPWAGGAKIAGGTTITADAPLAEIPVFARAGTLVPTYPPGVMTLSHGSPEVPDESLVGDDRIVYAFLGDASTFTEASGLAYTIEAGSDGSGDLNATWNGAPLAICADPAVAPCLSIDADGGRAYVTGPGTLDVKAGATTIAKLTATGGKGSRKITWAIRR